MPVNRETLLKDLRPIVRRLEDNLRERSAEVPEFDERLRGEWQAAKDAKRLSETFESWREGRIAQAAVGWILGTVFVRFCEDNKLIPEPWIAAPDDTGLGVATDREAAWYREDDERMLNATAREWLLESFKHLRESNYVLAGLFDEKRNPLYWITPDRNAAKQLLDFWRQPGEETATIHSFEDPELDTRFLGDLYQDLSDHAKKTYALLQTPEFVEEFILDRTMNPALEEFGVDPVYPLPLERERRDLPIPPNVLRVIDPTCGSGHFLIGAFRRLLAAWRKSDKSNRMTRQELINRVLTGIHGVDKNPFAVEIARFRLLIEATKADEVQPLTAMPNWIINVAVGDSLLHGRGVIPVKDELVGLSGIMKPEEKKFHTYEIEDVDDFSRAVDILGIGSYHVVVGNPPYITVKDGAESELYKERYSSCYRQYSLSIPFAERFFRLAIRDDGTRASGHVGQITANSFMKREFGKKLVEEFFWAPPKGLEHRAANLTEIIDTSGAYIPGHGTPTVILVGRNVFPKLGDPIRAVLGIRGEPGVPDDPAIGQVWSAIVDQIDRPVSESSWVSVDDFNRIDFSSHPISLSGGQSGEVFGLIDASPRKLLDVISVLGRTTHTGLDEAFYGPREFFFTRQLDVSAVPVVIGEDLRDYLINPNTWTLFPYDQKGAARTPGIREARQYWQRRVVLRARMDFGQGIEERGLRWFDHSMFFSGRFSMPLSVAFSFVATHNHFALDRGGKVFNRSAPVIKLPEEASEDDHLNLLGLLNSSTACFWLKQVSHNKGGQGINEGFKSQEWERFYEFTGTKLQEFPLPAKRPMELARELDLLAQEIVKTEPSAVCGLDGPSARALEAARIENELIRHKMVALQEELDWQTYGLYGLLDEAEVAVLQAKSFDEVPEVALGQRAFEIVMARKMQAGELETTWFERHRSTPVTEIPTDWPSWYQALVQRRIAKIESDRNIRLIEQPEYKRRWAHDTWEKRQKEALRAYLLDACEERSLWFDDRNRAVPRTVNNLADALRGNDDVVSAARLYANSPTADLAKVLIEVIDTEHVPFLKSMRFKDSGLRKHEQWVKTWKLQREEDETETTLDIDVPPKYTSADFLKPSYWRNRGKLDVAKERFISYPGLGPVTDDSLLIGWAGWDHRDQAIALSTLFGQRRTGENWDGQQLIPVLLGLDELQFWLEQWHREPDPALGGRIPAEFFPTMRNGYRDQLGLTDPEIEQWRPPKNTRRGRKKQA
jgi:hypothetical protein